MKRPLHLHLPTVEMQLELPLRLRLRLRLRLLAKAWALVGSRREPRKARDFWLAVPALALVPLM